MEVTRKTIFKSKNNMAEFSLPEFSINSSSSTEDILNLMKIIKPSWDVSDIEIKSMSGGYSSSMYKVSHKIELKDCVTVRIRNVFADLDIPGYDREFENKIIQILSRSGVFPKVHAIFKNGYCYQYIEGKPIFDITPETSEGKKYFDPDKFPLKLIATKMAEIHCIKIENEDFSKSALLGNILDILNNHYPTISHPAIADKDDVYREFTELLKHSKKFNFNNVLCHGDAHLGNIVWNEEKNELTFVDWELTFIGIQTYDIAFLLASMTEPIFLNLSGFLSITEDVAEDIKKTFIRQYLEEYSKLSNFELTEEYVSEFERHVKFSILIWYLTIAAHMGPVMQEGDKCPYWDRISTFGLECYQRHISVKDKVYSELHLI